MKLSCLAMAALTAGSLKAVVMASCKRFTWAAGNLAGPTAANRIITGTGADADLSAGAIYRLVYDGAASRWLVQNGANGGVDFNAVAPISYNGGTKNLTCDVASNSQPGCISAANHTIFSNKEDAITATTSADYYRGDKTFQTLNTLAVPENTNLYYTAARFNTAFSGKSTTDLAEGTNLYYTASRFNTAFSGKSTTDLAEGSNLYFTDTRAKTAAVLNTLAGSETDQAPSVAAVNTALGGKQATGNYITALTGDATASGPGSAALTLATVNSNVGSFTNASITVNAKGLITAASTGTTPVTSITVASANGFTGSSSGGATPALTLATSVTGILQGNGTAISAASTTGTGNLVLATSPTIVTPTIAKLANLTTNGFTKTSGGDGTLSVQASPIPTADIGATRTINAQTGTTYTFVLADGSGSGGHPLVTGTNAAAQTYTVPPNSSVAFPTGTQIDVCQFGAGKLTLAQGAGVTITSLSGNKAIAAQYVCVTIVKYGTDTWNLVGNLVP